MGHFVSTSENRIDRKGRVSIPAAYRTHLGDRIADGLYVVPALDSEEVCIEIWPAERMQKFVDAINQNINDMSDEDQLLADLVMADSRFLTVEDAGRIHPPADMLADAGISDVVIFLGRGDHFTMWAPEHYQRHRALLSSARQPGANRRVRQLTQGKGKSQ